MYDDVNEVEGVSEGVSVAELDGVLDPDRVDVAVSVGARQDVLLGVRDDVDVCVDVEEDVEVCDGVGVDVCVGVGYGASSCNEVTGAFTLLCTYAPAAPAAMPTKKVCTKAASAMVPLHTTAASGAALSSTRSCAPTRDVRWQSPHQSSPRL